MTFEVWESPNEITMCYKKDRHTVDIDDNAKLIYSINEPDYNKAMAKCHEFLEWEPYIPMEEY